MSFVRSAHDSILNTVGFSQFPAPAAAPASTAQAAPATAAVAAPVPKVPELPKFGSQAGDPWNMSLAAFIELKTVMVYDPETGFFTWTKRVSASAGPGERAGVVNDKGYRRIKYKGRTHSASHVAVFFMTGEIPVEVDHEDLNPTNDAWLNLRPAAHSQNQGNRARQRNNTSGFKGVSFNKTHGRWYAFLRRHGRNKNLGSFNTPEEAHVAYAKAAYEHFGEFARVS